MFEKLLKDGKFRTKEENERAGAKAFKKIFQGGFFAGLFEKCLKTKEEVISLILEHNLASNPEEAETFFRDLLNKKVHYKEYDWFELTEVSYGSHTRYELRLYGYGM